MSNQEYFFEKLNSKINEIVNQEKENDRLRQLILYEEKKHLLMHNNSNK